MSKINQQRFVLKVVDELNCCNVVLNEYVGELWENNLIESTIIHSGGYYTYCLQKLFSIISGIRGDLFDKVYLGTGEYMLIPSSLIMSTALKNIERRN